jgi:ketosteroid isomerase-like protein
MSANLDLVRSIYAAWERGDYSSAAWAHPEIEFAIVDGPSPGSWKGLAGMAHGWAEFLSAFKEHRVTGEECRELDEERVLGFAHASGRGAASGVEVGQTRWGANVFHLSEGRVTRLLVYWDRENALADLGLAG